MLNILKEQQTVLYANLNTAKTTSKIVIDEIPDLH